MNLLGLLRPVYNDTTQLELRSPTIGNATDPVAAYSQSAQSRSVELSCVGVAIDTSPTQLNSTPLNVELSCVAINGPLIFCNNIKNGISDLMARP